VSGLRGKNSVFSGIYFGLSLVPGLNLCTGNPNLGIIATILKLAQEKMNTSGEEKKKGARQSTTL
jgi:hypothetical protein